MALLFLRQEVKGRWDEEDAVITAGGSHMEKMANRDGSDATHSSSFHNLWMPLAQLAKKLFQGRGGTRIHIRWSDLSPLLESPKPRG